jgi:hypothetical protein
LTVIAAAAAAAVHRYTWDVQEGDIIVAASDGLFDNLWDEELLALLPQGLLGAPPPLDSTMSLTGMDSLGRSAGKKLLSRSRSFAALTRSSSIAGMQASASAAAAPVPEQQQGNAAGGSALQRSRSTSQLASWGAKKLSWGRSKGAKAAAAVANAGYSLAEDDVFAEAAAAAAAPAKPVSPADASQADVARAAELLAAAAAAHAADKEFRSPWSVAAGKAFGLLARLFAKGGKMDDITCVVAVVQDAGKARAKAAEAAAAGSAAAGVSGSPVSSSLGTASPDSSSTPVSSS